MSQEKVDKYKQEKANRKKIIAKQKLKKKLYILAGALVTVAFAIWIGWSVYAEQKAKKEQEEMMAALQSQILEIQNAAQTATGSTGGTTGKDATTGNSTTTGGETTTGNGATTGNETTTAAADKSTSTDNATTSAGEKTSSEATTEEETTTSAN